jgi:hypothetical protein
MATRSVGQAAGASSALVAREGGERWSPKAASGLLDTLRGLASGSGTQRIVLAGASGKETVALVSAGLAIQARNHDLRILIAQLGFRRGRPILVEQRVDGRPVDEERARTDRDRESDSSSGDNLEPCWVEAGRQADLVVVEGPPLAGSIDSALLAQSCDGLVIVVEQEVTPREALKNAVASAQITGCRVLGVVMTQARDWLPRWAQRLFATGHRRRLLRGAKTVPRIEGQEGVAVSVPEEEIRAPLERRTRPPHETP